MSAVAEPQPVVVGDVADLPDGVFGPRSVPWWGNIGFMMVEGTAFLLAAGAYLYIRTRGGAWPPAGDKPPDLLWGALFTTVLLVSELPNLWLEHQARRQNRKAVRWGAVVVLIFGVVLTVLRGFELAHLNVRWSHDAYGSLVWLLMVLHTTHVLTQLGEAAVETAWLFTHEVETTQFSDVHDGCAYWTFVLVAWLPLYVLIYWAPRLL